MKRIKKRKNSLNHSYRAYLGFSLSCAKTPENFEKMWYQPMPLLTYVRYFLFEFHRLSNNENWKELQQDLVGILK